MNPGSPGYETISYAWGEQSLLKALQIENCGCMPITESLYEALQHFRYIGQIWRLWADAVCINQMNIGELPAQVEAMAHIYAEADRVLVWLGTPSGLTRPLSNTLK